MGYYIETGGNHDKAKAIVAMYGANGAKIIPEPLHFEDVPVDKAIICVVDKYRL